MVSVASVVGTAALPIAGATTQVYLSGGVDAATADADVAAALAAFTSSYGPGQVSYPGGYSSVVYGDLANHANSYNRIAVLDTNPTHTTASALVADAQAVQTAVTDASRTSLFGPWLVAPGSTGSYFGAYPRSVAPCALAAAKMASVSYAGDADTAAAGVKNGAASYVTGVAVDFNSTDRATLNNAGVNVIRNVSTYGVVAVYGFNTLSLDANFTQLNYSRFRMQIINDLDAIAEKYVFAEIDGTGKVFSAFAGDISGVLQGYYMRGSLYGANATNAFSVDVGSTVNTPATIAAGQLNANVAVVMSPAAEFVTINVSKYLASSPLAA
jgi:phage tail sheath protein FI